MTSSESGYSPLSGTMHNAICNKSYEHRGKKQIQWAFILMKVFVRSKKFQGEVLRAIRYVLNPFSNLIFEVTSCIPLTIYKSKL